MLVVNVHHAVLSMLFADQRSLAALDITVRMSIAGVVRATLCWCGAQ